MKCELVAALLHKPKVLFLDEPTIGLDVVAQKNIRDFIKRYNQKNKTTIILTSHYMEDVKELCKRVIIMEEGKIGYDGDLASLIEKYAPYKVLKITFEGEGVKKADIEKYGEVHKFSSQSITLRVPREKAKNIARDILSSDLPVDDILIDEVDISDVVRKIFNNNKS
jgi:ABC-2 type transport system ATP-binding protein